MKHAWTKILLAVAAALTFGLALAGCSNGDEKKYDHLVTFNYNAVGIADVPEQYLGVKNQSYLLAPTTDNNDFKLQSIKGYAVEGWFLPATDEDGNVKRGDDGRVVLDKEWNFQTDRVTEKMTLYANLSRKSSITVIGVEVLDDGTVSEFEKLDNELVLLGTPGTSVVKSGDAKKDDYTLVGYYTDKTLSTEFDWNHTYGEEDETIYARFLEGANWSIVSTPSEFSSAISSRSNIFLKNDIDYADGTEWTSKVPYAGTILGNGHKVKNITCNWNSSRDVATYGFFGGLGAKFHVSDLSFENVNITFNAVVAPAPKPGYYKVSAFALSVSEEATFENFSFSATLTLIRTSDSRLSDIFGYQITETPPASIASMFTVGLDGEWTIKDEN